MLFRINMKNYFVKLLSIAFVSVFFVACGGIDDEETINTTSQVDQGYLQQNQSDISNVAKSLLDIKAIVGENSKKLSNIRICTDEKCWTVIKNEDISIESVQNKSIARQVSSISSSSSLVTIGTYNVSDINETIDRIKYTYNGKDGELELQNKLNLNTDQEKNLYLQLDEDINVPFSSLSIEDGKNGIYIPSKDFKKEFINGVILDIPKDASSEMAHIYIKNIGKTIDEKIETNAYLIKFYSLDPMIGNMKELKNRFPNKFLNDINIYLPINYFGTNINDTKVNYTLTINDFETEYEIIFLNNQYYIYFNTNNSTMKIILFSNDEAL